MERKQTPTAEYINRISDLNGKVIGGKTVLCATFNFEKYGIEFEDGSVYWMMEVANEGRDNLEQAIQDLGNY